MLVGQFLRRAYSGEQFERTWRVVDIRVPQKGELYIRTNGSVTRAPSNTVKTARAVVEEILGGVRTAPPLPLSPPAQTVSNAERHSLLKAYDEA